MPLLLGGKAKDGRMEGDVEYDVGDKGSFLSKVLTAFRFLIMLSAELWLSFRVFLGRFKVVRLIFRAF